MDSIPDGLQTLNLNRNYITTLHSPKVEKKLLYLDLSGNNLSWLNYKIFAHMPSLKLLTLSNNMLKSLDFYKHLPISLHKLDLRTNHIETLTENDGEIVQFNHLQNLEDIYISQNLWICSCNFQDLYT